MTNGESVEVVRELADDLPNGWRWRPQMVENGEAQRLLQRQADIGLPQSARDEIVQSGMEIIARCVSPNEEADSQETGLVVGYVQSGKTLSFTDCCRARVRQSLPAGHCAVGYEEEPLQPDREASQARPRP